MWANLSPSYMKQHLHISIPSWPKMPVASATRHERFSQGCVDKSGRAIGYGGLTVTENSNPMEAGR